MATEEQSRTVQQESTPPAVGDGKRPQSCGVQDAAASAQPGALGEQVAQHYNKLENAGLDVRTQSRIFYLRNFNNWIKSMAINDVLTRLRRERGSDTPITVLDLAAGKGGDLQKWRKGRISRLVCADIAGTSVEQAQERYKDMVERGQRGRFPQKTYSAEFITADCSKEQLARLYRNPDQRFDLTSCQFSLHYSFETHAQADMMLRNACEALTPGGYFIMTIPNADEIVKRLRAAEGTRFGNEVYHVDFLSDDKRHLPLFGAKYDFHLEGVVDCPEFLVYFPLLEKLLEKYGMKLVEKKTFAEYFTEMVETQEGRNLIGHMQALEPYPSDADGKLMSSAPDAYSHAQSEMARLTQNEANNEQRDSNMARGDYHRRDGTGQRPMKIGTLSQAEWEAATFYLYCSFQKHPLPSEMTRDTGSSREPESRGRKRPHGDDAPDAHSEEPAQKDAKH